MTNNKLDVDLINRLRGVGGDKPAETPKQADKSEPQKTSSASVEPAKTAALNNLLNSVPDNPVPESERKYTTKDLDDFLDNFMKSHS